MTSQVLCFQHHSRPWDQKDCVLALVWPYYLGQGLWTPGFVHITDKHVRTTSFSITICYLCS